MNSMFKDKEQIDDTLFQYFTEYELIYWRNSFKKLQTTSMIALGAGVVGFVIMIVLLIACTMQKEYLSMIVSSTGMVGFIAFSISFYNDVIEMKDILNVIDRVIEKNYKKTV